MIMKRKVVFRSVGVAMASAMLAGDKTKSERAFDRLTSPQDEWKGETGGVNTALIYTLTANCSALMEPVDGNHLIATHYCTAANQAQMETPPTTDVQKVLEFSLVRVTGLKSPDDFHNTGLTVIQDNDHLTQE